MNGKGDAPRPVSVSADEYERRWAATFGATLNAMRDRLSAELHAQVHGAAPIAEPDSPHRLVRHEPDPRGGRNSDT